MVESAEHLNFIRHSLGFKVVKLLLAQNLNCPRDFGLYVAALTHLSVSACAHRLTNEVVEGELLLSLHDEATFVKLDVRDLVTALLALKLVG